MVAEIWTDVHCVLNACFTRMLTGFQTSTSPANIFFAWQWRTSIVNSAGFRLLDIANNHQSWCYRQTYNQINLILACFFCIYYRYFDLVVCNNIILYLNNHVECICHCQSAVWLIMSIQQLCCQHMVLMLQDLVHPVNSYYYIYSQLQGKAKWHLLRLLIFKYWLE